MTSSAPPSRWSPAVEEARQHARSGLVEQNLPGLSVAVGVGGELVWAEAFGYADVEKKTAATPLTRFRVTDASAALTSAAVGLLLDKKMLHLDDEIQVHVPEFPKKQWPVTLRHLMAQTAGVRTDGGDEAAMPRCETTLDALTKLDNFGGRDLIFEPGTEFRPSTYGYVLLSAAVEGAADEPFFSFMRTKIFEPLGMRDTTVDIAADPIPDRAHFYFPRFAADTRYGHHDARAGQDHSCYAGAGAFLSTATDLVRFGMAFNSGKLVKPETVQLLQTEQKVASGEPTGYGLGWRVQTLTLAGRPAWMAGHGSKEDFIGGTMYLMTFPERGLVIAAMTNTSFADTKGIALKIAEAFAKER